MIKIFRNIRQKLLAEGKTTNYLKYAIGEIVLVVIGILIALQINNWNQIRLAKIEEQTILSNLHQEFLRNKETLNLVIKQNGASYHASVTIMDLIGKSRAEIESINTDSLLYKSIDYNMFSPSENALSDLLQSGRLQLLKNENLKELLYQWSSIMKNGLENYEGVDSKIENDLVPYLTLHHSLKDIDFYGPLNWKRKSELKVDKLKIFEDIEYENLMDDYLFRLLTYFNNLNEARIIIDDIINKTNIK